MESIAKSASHRRSRVKDYAVYVLITFAFLGGVFILESKWGHETFIRWGGLAGFTAVLFGYFLSESRRFAREWQFWSLSLVLLAGHLTAFSIVLTHVEEWRLMWFLVMAVEYPIFVFLRSRLLPE